MAFSMKFSKEQLEGPKPVPPGIYTVQFIKFAPKLSSKGDSVNLNAQVKVVGHPDYDGRMIFYGCNTKLPNWIQDFVISFGLEMENMGQDDASIPGDFSSDKTKFVEADPSTWVYAGPLTGRTAQWDIAVEDDNKGQPRNVPRMFIPAIPDLAIKWPHVRTTMDMTKNKS